MWIDIMRLILETADNNAKIEIPLSWIALAFLLILSCFIALSCWLTKQSISKVTISDQQMTTIMQQPLQEIATIKQQAQHKLDAYSAYLASIQARIVRLDAMGQRLTGLAGINDEFDFSESVGLDSIDENQTDSKDAFTPPTFMQALDDLSAKLATREKQLELLEHLIVKQDLRKDSYIAGQPVVNGYVTSRYGVRIDPITGRSKGHKGIDFSAPRGASVKAVAFGVVTFAGVKTGYGNVVEISHLDGYKTIYAHNQQNLVKAGDLVTVEQTIAKVGSTGRATGPHVHFEVQKNNQVVNPISYISRVHKNHQLPLIQTASVK